MIGWNAGYPGRRAGDKFFPKEFLWLFCGVVFVFLLRWAQYFVDGSFPFLDWGSSLLWADWTAYNYWAVLENVVIEWNPLYVLGCNNVSNDPFNNPLALNNLIGHFFDQSTNGWLVQLFLFECVLSFGLFVYLRKKGLSFVCALFPALLILIFPKTSDDLGHGPGKFIGWQAVIPWLFLLMDTMFEQRPKVKHYWLLGTLCALGFLSGGAMVGVMVGYLFIPYYLYKASVHVWVRASIKESFRVFLLGPTLSLVVCLGISSYLLLPLLDEVFASARSIYGGLVGYNLIDFSGMFFPWINLVSVGEVHNYSYDIPVLGSIATVRFYFGILTLPALIFVLCNRKKMQEFGFFAIYPVCIFIAYSKVLNELFPLASGIDKMLGVSSNENFMMFNMFFCLVICLAVMIDRLSCSSQGECYLSSPNWLVKATRVGGFVYLGLASSVGLLMAIVFVSPTAPASILQYISDTISPISGYRHTALLFLVYAYTSTSLAFFLVVSFFARSGQLLMGASFLEVGGKRPAMIFAIMILDFLCVLNVISPLTQSLNDRYFFENELNNYVDTAVPRTSRIGASHYFYDAADYSKRATSQLSDLVRHDLPKTPREAYEELALTFQEHKGNMRPIMGLGATSYPVTIGKQVYNYHSSFMPDYFYAYDHAMNAGNPNYVRSSWNGLWDPKSKLLDIAGIEYLFWSKPVVDDRYVLEKVTQSPISYIYRNNSAVEKAYLVHSVKPAGNDENALALLQASDFDPHKEAVVDQDSVENSFLLSSLVDNTYEAVGDRLKVINYSANTIDIELASNQDGLLVVSDMFHPYWTSYVNGVEVPIHRVNVAFRGIEIPAGTHHVSLVFKNPAFHLGVKVSLISTALTILFFLGALWRDRSRGNGLMGNGESKDKQSG